MRMSRRMGLLGRKMPLTLDALFNDMNVLGYRGQTSSTCDLNITGFDTSTPYYVFLLRGPSGGIYTVTGSTSSRLNKYGNTTLSLTVSDTTVSNTHNIYNGGVIMAVRFPHYADNDIQSMLSTMSFTAKAAMNVAFSPQTASFASNEVNSNAIYISSFTGNAGTPSNGLSFSMGSNIFTPLYSWYSDNATQTSAPGTKNYVFLYQSGSEIYISITGTSANEIRLGSIVELVLPTV